MMVSILMKINCIWCSPQELKRSVNSSRLSDIWGSMLILKRVQTSYPSPCRMNQSALMTTKVLAGATSNANVRIASWHTLCAYKAKLWANGSQVVPIPLTGFEKPSLALSSKVRKTQKRVVETSSFRASHLHSEVMSHHHPRYKILKKVCVASHYKRPQRKTQIQARCCLRCKWVVSPSS